MAHLCREPQEALTRQDWPAVSARFKEQRDFLAGHLLNWVPAFCADIEKCAATDFYKAAAKITNGYLRMEQAIIDDLIAEPVVVAA